MVRNISRGQGIKLLLLPSCSVTKGSPQKKPGYFTVRLTVSVYPPYGQLFMTFFVFFILAYDARCSEMDFTPEK